ncbi:hypothetical protein [Maridesulfovibrio salexigens]|uniref:Uncharacterized protein n=1 Tax=Maridesulfovibrio salexigens (strain ATCC 14822 / DSM 2638 / NCIMB 8403 / VKM B-1763) TaxID=526222 RepID=C6BVZ2_MARSD|nr:hypothetical protein [Maridesulfovibrio salexigens]ACS80195.1 hypothetical protein Desal_2136 [Maridesulfovibrio salexigens DSM 2638]
MGKFTTAMKYLFGSSDLNPHEGSGTAIEHATRLVEDPKYRTEMEKLYGKENVDEAIKNGFPSNPL